VPYILFLASGSICMSAMNAASFEALYSAFSRMHVQKTWDGIMNAPVSLDNVVLAEMLWAAFKALFTVTAILCVMLALGISHSWKLLVAWPVLLGVGIMFSSIALIFNALAKGYDFFTYYFTLVLTPMMFLSGVFFPREQLPPVVRAISAWLPLTNAVELVRPLFMDQWPTGWWLHAAVLAVYAVAAFWIALALTRKRFMRRLNKRVAEAPRARPIDASEAVTAPSRRGLRCRLPEFFDWRYLAVWRKFQGVLTRDSTAPRSFACFHGSRQVDVREPRQVTADRLSQWFGWTDAISLSAALNGNPAASASGARAGASAEENECPACGRPHERPRTAPCRSPHR
jgi:lipooligosaccharide transport system permease protein